MFIATPVSIFDHDLCQRVWQARYAFCFESFELADYGVEDILPRLELRSGVRENRGLVIGKNLIDYVRLKYQGFNSLKSHLGYPISWRRRGENPALPEPPLCIWETEQPLRHLFIRRFGDG